MWYGGTIDACKVTWALQKVMAASDSGLCG